MYNAKKKATNERYLSKFKTLSVRIPLEWMDDIQFEANKAGQSTSGYILQAVRERMHPNDDMVRISVPREQIQPLADAAGMTAKEYLAQALQDALTK